MTIGEPPTDVTTKDTSDTSDTLTAASMRRLRRATGVRFFSSSADAPRVRRPTDVLLFILSSVTVLGLAFVAPGPTALDTALIALLDSLPGFVSWIWELSYALLVIWVLVLALASLFRPGRRRLLIDYLLGAVFALTVAVVASLAVGTSWDDTVHALVEASPPSVYLAVRLAVVTAIVVTASPHVARPFRYLGRGVILMGALAAVVLGIANPIGVMAGFMVGVAAAALAHLALGSPGGRPTAAQVADALVDFEVDVVDVSDAVVQVPGVALFDADTPDGGELLVKVFGRDAWDGQFLASIWTALWRRGERPHLGSGRLARVEHEALTALLAERAGVPVLPVVAVGRSVDGDAVIVSEVTGRPLAHLSVVDDSALHSMWQGLVKLHELGIAHGRIDGERIVLRADGTAALGDFGEAEVTANHGDLMTDRARLLVTTSFSVGNDRAIAAAIDIIGADGLAEVLPYLQPAVLSRPTRRAIADGEWSLDDLVTSAVAAAGVDAITREKIQRVTWKSVLITVAIGAFTYLVISKLMNVDFQAIWEELSNANPAYLLAALLLAPTVQVAMSFSTMGSSVAPLRFWPVLMLQYAIQFIALTLPATAARLALEVRFFQRFGIAPGAALSMGVIDSLSGFAVQVILLVLIAVSQLPGLTSSLAGGSSSDTSSTDSGPSMLAVAVVLVLAGLVLAAVVPRYRRRLRSAITRAVQSMRAQAVEVRGALHVLRSPAKVAQMLGGNFVAQVIQAIVLGICLNAFGYDAYLSQLILINTAVSLFAGLMPVPGGMGVAEAGYTAGLQAIGVPSAVALSTAIAFRLVTFYLPPIWGAFSMRWLRHHSYV